MPNEPYDRLYIEKKEFDRYDNKAKVYIADNGENWKIIELKDPKDISKALNGKYESAEVSNPNSRHNSTYGEGIPFYPRIAAKYNRKSIEINN